MVASDLIEGDVGTVVATDELQRPVCFDLAAREIVGSARVADDLVGMFVRALDDACFAARTAAGDLREDLKDIPRVERQHLIIPRSQFSKRARRLQASVAHVRKGGRGIGTSITRHPRIHDCRSRGGDDRDAVGRQLIATLGVSTRTYADVHRTIPAATSARKPEFPRALCSLIHDQRSPRHTEVRDARSVLACEHVGRQEQRGVVGVRVATTVEKLVFSREHAFLIRLK